MGGQQRSRRILVRDVERIAWTMSEYGEDMNEVVGQAWAPPAREMGWWGPKCLRGC